MIGGLDLHRCQIGVERKKKPPTIVLRTRVLGYPINLAIESINTIKIVWKIIFSDDSAESLQLELLAF